MSRACKFYLVDAFARRAFEGNAAAVVIVEGRLSDAVRQRCAFELQQAETAFVEVEGESASGGGGDGSSNSTIATASRFVLRWFTPTTEVPLCGHATLAASHVLVSELGNASPALVFRTVRGAGELTVRRGGGGEGGQGGGAGQPSPLLEMSLPMAEPRDPLPEALREPGRQRALVEALGLAWSGGGGEGEGGGDGGDSSASPRSRRLSAGRVLFAAARGINYALVEASCSPSPSAGGGGEPAPSAAAAARALREMRAPDPTALALTCPSGLAGVIVAVRGGEEDDRGAGSEGGGGTAAGRAYRCTSRFFAPWMGIDEDAVTGSAHSVLGPWLDSGGGGGQGEWWWARQASPRGGDVRVRVDRESGRVMVAGEATTVVRGEIELPTDE